MKIARHCTHRHPGEGRDPALAFFEVPQAQAESRAPACAGVTRQSASVGRT